MKIKLILLSLILGQGIFSFSENIHEIQGNTHNSVYENKKVENVEGIVTKIFKDKYHNGFFMQAPVYDNDINTSEGIYVENKSSINVELGDLIKVNGIVKEIFLGAPNKEYPTTTSISAEEISVSGKNYTVKPVIIDGANIPKKVHNGNFEKMDSQINAMDYYESLESMLVEIKDPLITGFKEKYGDITVVPSKGKYTELKSVNGGVIYNNYEFEQSQRLTITANDWKLSENQEYKNSLSPNPGDLLKGDVKGIITYNFGEYRLLPTSEFPGVIDRETKPEKNQFKYNKKMLNVVSYNIENFSVYDNPERAELLAKQVKGILQTPDILGLIEVGDDNGGSKKEDVTLTSAQKNIEAIVSAIEKETGIKYGYMNIDPIHGKDGGWPEMHIRNVILYRLDRVKVPYINKGDSTVNTVVKKDKHGKIRLSLNPGKIGIDEKIWDEVRKPLIGHFIFKGKNLFVLANHLKSKRADAKIYGTIQPVIRKSEIIRNPEGTYINNFVKQILAIDKNAEIIVLGDMNDFEFSQTIKNINGNELIDVISQLPKNERSTYVYQGNAQTLDNIMIKKKYNGKVNVDVIRVNSEFTKAQGSFSDHDPVFIQYKVR